MGLLEGYFVPLYSFSLTPETFEDKVHNIQFAFELMQDAGLPKPKARPEGENVSWCIYFFKKMFVSIPTGTIMNIVPTAIHSFLIGFRTCKLAII